jgi:hypothetical protein
VALLQRLRSFCGLVTAVRAASDFDRRALSVRRRSELNPGRLSSKLENDKSDVALNVSIVTIC